MFPGQIFQNSILYFLGTSRFIQIHFHKRELFLILSIIETILVDVISSFFLSETTLKFILVAHNTTMAIIVMTTIISMSVKAELLGFFIKKK